MAAPKFNTSDGPPKCPRCGEPIRYQERTRFGGEWLHQRCSNRTGLLKHLRETAEDLCGADTPGFRHCLAIMACMNTDSFNEAAELSKLGLAFIEKAMQPLIEQGVYRDGIWCVDGDVDLDDGQHCAIQILMWTLCSEGKIQRVRPADRADPSVP